jgi:hypothetical protein
MWNMRSEDQLKEWRTFRSHIGDLSFDEAVKETVHLWSYAPFVNHYLDHMDPLTWPSPWDLLLDNRFDDTAKALGMLYTLYLSPHGKDHKFEFIIADSTLERYNLVQIDEGKYVLNFVFNEVISKEQLEKEVAPEIIKTYSETDLQLTKY